MRIALSTHAEMRAKERCKLSGEDVLNGVAFLHDVDTRNLPKSMIVTIGGHPKFKAVLEKTDYGYIIKTVIRKGRYDDYD